MKFIVIITAIYIILASICCKFMAVLFYYPASIFGDVKIIESPIDWSEKFSHIYLTINGKVFEPRYLGLIEHPSVEYNIILSTYNNPTEYLKTHTVIPFYH